MKKIIRHLAIAYLSGLALFGATQTLAQTYPSQTIKIVVPFPAGGGTDMLARLVAQKLQDSWHQPVVVENKPGAGGSIGAAQVAKAAPDGYTVLFNTTSMIQLTTLMKLSYDPHKDFTPISRVAISTSVLAAAPTVPASTLSEFVKLVKAQPGKHSFGTYGPGSSAHFQGEMLNLQAGTDLMHIPYQGSAPLITAMLGGQVSSSFLDAGSSRQHLSKFKLLAVTGTERLSWLPNVPTLKEQGYNGFESRGWFGIFLPAGVPKPVVDKFSAEVLRLLKLPEVREKIESMGLIPGGESSEHFAKVMKHDAEVYARIIRDAKITMN